jgi:hypothetical protein
MMVSTQMIPQEQWLNYFNELSRHFTGWGISIEVMRQDLGDQHSVDRLVFQGVSFESKGSERGNILIEAGDLPQSLVIHQIVSPCLVQVAETRPGRETYLHIGSDDGSSTLVTLRRLDQLPAVASA